MRKCALMLVVAIAATPLSCALAQAVGLTSLFLSWPIQEVDRRQAMVTAGFPAVVVTTRPVTDDPKEGREVVGVVTDPNGLIRVPWDTELEIHLSYALSGGSVADCYAVVGGAQAERGRRVPEPDLANRFGRFDARTQILRVSYADKVEAQRRYNLINPGVFREELPLQIVSVDPKGERKESNWPWLFFLRTVSHRATFLSQTLMFHWENERNWTVGCPEVAPTSARQLREQIATLRMWRRSSVDVSGDSFAAKLFTAIESEMQVWISSPQVAVEYLDQQGRPTHGPRLTGLVLFFPKGSIVPKPWLPGQPVEWRRLVGKDVQFPDYIEELVQRHPDATPYILLWKGDRSHAHFLIHQATLATMYPDLQVGFLAISQPVGDTDYRWWDWAEGGGADGAVVPLASGAVERRVIVKSSQDAPRSAQVVEFGDLLFGVRPEPAPNTP